MKKGKNLIGKRFFSAAVSVCLIAATVFSSVFPAKAELREGTVRFGAYYADTLSFGKTLDLSDLGVSVQITPEEQDALKKQAKDEFAADLRFAIGDVLEAREKLEAQGTKLILDDGSYNPAWNESWKQAYPYTETAKKREINEIVRQAEEKAGDDWGKRSLYRRIAQNNFLKEDAPSEYSATNRYWLLNGTTSAGYPFIGYETVRPKIRTIDVQKSWGSTEAQVRYSYEIPEMTFVSGIDSSQYSYLNTPLELDKYEEAHSDGGYEFSMTDDDREPELPKDFIDTCRGGSVSKKLVPKEASFDDLQVGTLLWWKLFEPLINMDESNERVKQYIDTYVSLRTNDLMSDLLNERLGDSLKGVKFDFYAEELSDSEAADPKFGIGKNSDTGLSVEAGKFAGSDTEGRFRLSTVDFGAENQKYDGVLTETLTKYKTENPLLKEVNKIGDGYVSLDSADKSRAMLFTTNGRELFTYLLLANHGAIASESLPFVQFGGSATTGLIIDENNTGNTLDGSDTPDENPSLNPNNIPLWPGVSATRGEEDLNWSAEDLSDYENLSPQYKESYESDDKYYAMWSFSDEIPLTGDNALTFLGDNLFYPVFDEKGNVVSITKPLVNALSAVSVGKFSELAEIAEKRQTVSYGNFDQSALIKAVFGETLYNTPTASVKRFKLVEEKPSITVGGRPLEENKEEKLLDVTPFGLMIFDNVDAANEYYGKVLSLNGENTIDHDSYTSNMGLAYMIKYGASFTNRADTEKKINFQKLTPEGAPLSGADMEIMTGSVSDPKPLDDQGTYRWTTGDTPASLWLAPGEYVLVEHSVPEGYVKIANTPFTVDEDYNVTIGDVKFVTYNGDTRTVQIVDDKEKTPPPKEEDKKKTPPPKEEDKKKTPPPKEEDKKKTPSPKNDNKKENPPKKEAPKTGDSKNLIVYFSGFSFAAVVMALIVYRRKNR